MAATYTRQDLVNRVGSLLGVKEIGQDLQPEDYQLIDAQVDPTCLSLASREVVYLASTVPGWLIPAAIFLELAACVAAAVPDYGQALSADEAEARIRLMQRRGPSYEPARGEYF